MNKPKTVEDYLNSVDYTNYEGYVPSEFALQYVNFIKLVNGADGEENKTPITHLKMLDQMVTGHTNIANLCHRGLAKTTIFAEYLFLYLGVYGELPGFGEVPFAIYVSDSIENGVKNMRKNLEYRRENSEFLQKYIPNARFTDVTIEFENVEGRRFILKLYGAKTGVRGAKAQGKRPVLAVLDDLVSDEDARSATVISAIEDTVYKAVDHALHPKKNLTVWSGTPFNSRDPLYKAIESGAWAVNVFPVCETFPCSREEFKSSWPDRFDYDAVNAKYQKALKSGKIEAFNQELMLRIMSEEDRLIHDNDIQWYVRSNVVENKHFFNFYITTDFATSEAANSDYSVISVWAYNSNGDWFWVDGTAKKQQMDANIDDLFNMVQKYKPESVGIEISGQQFAFISWIQNEMMRRNVYFTLARQKGSSKAGIRPVVDKFSRFRLVEPLFKTGKIFFPKEMKEDPILQEAMNELSLVSFSGFKSKHDDFIDTISMLSQIQAWKPSTDGATLKNNSGNGLWELDIEDEDLEGYDSYIV